MKFVVAGGRAAGLAASPAVARAGHEAVVLERDLLPPVSPSVLRRRQARLARRLLDRLAAGWVALDKAEGEGFEPSDDLAAVNGFRVCRVGSANAVVELSRVLGGKL
jgi:2-polyprenyl-6-methoxyphenol hydroxylase-like FAD-dependent oxidoreductase